MIEKIPFYATFSNHFTFFTVSLSLLYQRILEFDKLCIDIECGFKMRFSPILLIFTRAKYKNLGCDMP